MQINPSESKYDINFRRSESEILGQHIRNQHSVEILGMKRVGIGNFLNYFIYQPKVNKTYINAESERLFINVDLNDLIEREIFPFWRLTFKRIVDSIEYNDIPADIEKEINNLFVKNIQTGDEFLTLDAIRKSIMLLTNAGIIPVIYFIRFDRLRNAVTKQFFNNLKSLRDATHEKLTFVFTGDRSLHDIAPNIFAKTELNGFTHEFYLIPAEDKDMRIIINEISEQYKMKIEKQIKEEIIKNSAGHVQYARLSLIIINELINTGKYKKSSAIQKIVEDERIQLQSEEIYNNLNKEEQEILRKVFKGKKPKKADIYKAEYLWKSGLLNNKNEIFSPLFKIYLDEITKSKNSKDNETHLTKKEYLLFNALKENEKEIVPREKIEEIVWPEYSRYGVSDWSIDRLVSRLRKKIKILYPAVKIKTIRTRGFMLEEE